MCQCLVPCSGLSGWSVGATGARSGRPPSLRSSGPTVDCSLRSMAPCRVLCGCSGTIDTPAAAPAVARTVLRQWHLHCAASWRSIWAASCSCSTRGSYPQPPATQRKQYQVLIRSVMLMIIGRLLCLKPAASNLLHTATCPISADIEAHNAVTERLVFQPFNMSPYQLKQNQGQSGWCSDVSSVLDRVPALNFTGVHSMLNGGLGTHYLDRVSCLRECESPDCTALMYSESICSMSKLRHVTSS